MDNSFLRLKPTFEQAKTIGDPRQSTSRYYDSISLHPNETYLQITNSDVDIVFNQDYNVFLIDCNGNELLEITDNVFIEEFTDVNGIRQISFEIVNIGETFNEKVFLKFVHTTGNEIFYSNPFIVSDDLEYTLRLNYSSYGVFQGTDYLNAPFVQSIRVSGQYEGINDETENSTYIQSSGSVISENPTLVFSSAYKFNLVNDFTYRCLSVALKSNILFIDNKKVTDKAVIKKGQRLGNSNLYDAEVVLHVSDVNYLESNQISTPYIVNYFEPISFISVVNSLSIQIELSKITTLGNGTLRIYAENGTLLATLDKSDFNDNNDLITSNQLLSDYITLNIGKYYIIFDNGFFNSNISEQILPFDWEFEVSLGFYNETYYNSNYYLT